MTWSLKLTNGDLTIDGSHLGTVSNESKMVQDLRCQLLEKMGSDDLHPEFGSLIDGGVTPDGIIYESIVSDEDMEMAQLRIHSELQRVIQDYQNRQLDRARADKMRYNKQSLTEREIIRNIESINFVQNLDQLIVQVKVSTLGNSVETIDLTINGKEYLRGL